MRLRSLFVLAIFLIVLPSVSATTYYLQAHNDSGVAWDTNTVIWFGPFDTTTDFNTEFGQDANMAQCMNEATDAEIPCFYEGLDSATTYVYARLQSGTVANGADFNSDSTQGISIITNQGEGAKTLTCWNNLVSAYTHDKGTGYDQCGANDLTWNASPTFSSDANGYYAYSSGNTQYADMGATMASMMTTGEMSEVHVLKRKAVGTNFIRGSQDGDGSERFGLYMEAAANYRGVSLGKVGGVDKSGYSANNAAQYADVMYVVEASFGASFSGTNQISNSGTASASNQAVVDTSANEWYACRNVAGSCSAGEESDSYIYTSLFYNGYNARSAEDGAFWYNQKASRGYVVAATGGNISATISATPSSCTINRNTGVLSCDVDFNAGITPSAGGTVIDANWYVGGVLVKQGSGLDVNYARAFTDADWLDTNVFFSVSDENGSATDDLNFLTKSYPFDLNTIWSPTIPAKNESTDFNSSADSNSPIQSYLLENRTDDVNVMDANQVRSFSSSGTKQMRLHVHNSDDLNYTLDFSISVSGVFEACVWDENAGIRLPYANVYANGSSLTLDGNACFSYSVASLSTTANSTITFSADSNAGTYPTRYYVWDLNRFSEYDVNFLLVRDANAESVELTLYDTDESTSLGNTFVQVFNPTLTNIAGRNRTTSDGTITFYLNPNDPGYIYQVERATGTIWYYTTVVSCLVPLDESDTTTTITPFNIDVGGLGFQQYTGLAATQTFPMLSNTTEYYDVTITDPDEDYLQRSYAIRTRGDTNTYTLQPYLVDGNNGVLATFYLRDLIRSTSLGGILLVLSKNIPGVGATIVESTESDGTGYAILAYILADASGYSLRFYSQTGQLLDTISFRPALTSYNVDVLTDETAFTPPSFPTSIPKISFSPTDGRIPFSSTNEVEGFDVNVSGEGSPIITITVSQAATIIDTNIVSSYGSTRYDYNINDLDPDRFLNVSVQVKVGDNNYSGAKNFFINKQGFTVNSLISQITSNVDILGPGSGVWILIVIIFAVISSLGAYMIGQSAIGIGIIIATVAGIGFLIGLINIWIFILVMVAAIGGYLYTRR